MIYLILVLMSLGIIQLQNDPIDDSRFEIEVLTENVNQPMQMEILDDGKVIYIEKIGTIKVYDPITKSVYVAGNIPVNVNYSEPNTTAGDTYDADDGLHGIVLDPDFEINNFVYFYYSPKGGDSKSVLARYSMEDFILDEESKVILLEWPTQRNRCCHFGGGMIFDDMGNLLLAIGDNSSLGEAPSNAPRPEVYDPQRTSGNTNDLRGSILRIYPESDGTYSIPDGNLFPMDTPNTRPEIYIMGVRNPWRLSIDSKTGWLHWGEVGPSTEEFNVAHSSGNFGWPYFKANNSVFIDSFIIEENSETVSKKSENIVNDSPYNTGIRRLPAAEPALVWYHRNPDFDEFPIPGSGSLSAVGGPIYRRADFNNPERPFPDYYEGKWFDTDFVRGCILAIDMDDDGNYRSIEPFLKDLTFRGPIDMKFGPEGDLYVLEYSREPYVDSPADARIIRIKYNDGNRPPVVQASATRKAGSVPFELELISDGTKNLDGDSLEMKWIIESEGIGFKETFTEFNPKLTLYKPGIYNVTLNATGNDGLTNDMSFEVLAGNEPPDIEIDLIGANKSFYFSNTIEYNIEVYDHEDGSIEENGINEIDVNVWIEKLDSSIDVNYVSELYYSS